MPKPITKHEVVAAIQELLQKGSVKTQEEIQAILSSKGMLVNQTKISRILNELGAVKLGEGEEMVYRLPSELVNINLKNSLRQVILSITHNETLIVIYTLPGSAQLVARLLDKGGQTGILGTVAGDDTIFVAPEKIKNIKEVYEKIKKVFFA